MLIEKLNHKVYHGVYQQGAATYYQQPGGSCLNDDVFSIFINVEYLGHVEHYQNTHEHVYKSISYKGDFHLHAKTSFFSKILFLMFKQYSFSV